MRVAICVLLILAIVILECLGGQFSYYRHRGAKTWNYDKQFGHIGTTCNGYVSIPTTAYFSFIILLYIWLNKPHI